MTICFAWVYYTFCIWHRALPLSVLTPSFNLTFSVLKFSNFWSPDLKLSFLPCVSHSTMFAILLCCQLRFLSFSFQIDLRESRPIRQYKNFQIEVSNDGYRLYGTETFRNTLGELLEHLEGQSLRTDNLHFQLLHCCPPQPRGKLNPSTDTESDMVIYTKEHAVTSSAQIGTQNSLIQKRLSTDVQPLGSSAFKGLWIINNS